ncbi:MAG TPA: hypothetical protein VKF62_10575 [Planctomycetota bacterium]|nr:hypothetical protein [Planctomycetota bacterium]
MAKERAGRKPLPARRPEPVEGEAPPEKPGIDAGSGMALVTTLLLLVAIVLVWMELGHHYGAGPLAR